MTSSPVSPSDSAGAGIGESPEFGLLARPVQQWIWKSGWSQLRDIQESAIPLLLQGDRDLVIAAPTASGKTEAAFVPLLSRVVGSETGGGGFELVYVSPLKALINDQFRRLDELCEALEIPVHKWHGDVSGTAKARAIRDPRGVLLITPESLEAMFVRRGSEIPRLFAGVSSVVVDELHAMLDTERGMHLRSLLDRIEIAVRRRVRRVGLSATLGDMHLAKAYLRPRAADEVDLIKSESGGQQVRLLVKGYVVGGLPPDQERAEESGEAIEDRQQQASQRSIAAHLFKSLRGRQNLVFADSREQVEVYADRLRELSEGAHLPNEFYAHHANLARQHREFVEARLRKATEPTTAVCTSTLELGIDIGEVESIAQIGPPFSVSSTRQRLGRSGRREGKAAIMRTYVQESSLDSLSHPVDALRIRLVRSIAIIELLVEGWCEPPGTTALHLSTLVQQCLSVIAERGGATARTLFDALCRRGAFATVTSELFAQVLRSLGTGDHPLIEQAPDGTILLAARGETLVEHYTFYAVFGTPEEYRVTSEGRVLGSLPVAFAVVVDSTIILAGKRWRVTAVDSSSKVIDVVPDPSGKPPKFSGSPGLLHDRVAERMREVYTSDTVPPYLDATARSLLAEARRNYRYLSLDTTPILQIGSRQTLVLAWRGTVATETLALALVGQGLKAAARNHIVVEVDSGEVTVRRALRQIAGGRPPDPVSLVALMRDLEREKYHAYLSPQLRCIDAASARIAAEGLPELASQLAGIVTSREGGRRRGNG